MSEGIQKFNSSASILRIISPKTQQHRIVRIHWLVTSKIPLSQIFLFSSSLFSSCEKGCFGNVRNFSIIYSTMIHTFIFRRCYMMFFLPIFLCSLFSGCSFRQSFIGRTWNVKRNRNFSHCECQYFLPNRKYGFSVLLKVRSSSYLLRIFHAPSCSSYWKTVVRSQIYHVFQFFIGISFSSLQ